MEQIEEIITYVLKIPYNTNPNILLSILKQLAGEKPGKIEEEVYERINERKYGTDLKEVEG